MSVSVASAPCEDCASFTRVARPFNTAYPRECPATINRPNEGGDDQPAPVSPTLTSSRNAFIFWGDPRMCELSPFQCMEGTTSTNARWLATICFAKGKVLLFTYETAFFPSSPQIKSP